MTEEDVYTWKASSTPSSDWVRLQERIAGLVRVQPLPDIPSFVVGVDAGYVDGEGDLGGGGPGIGVGAAVVVDLATLNVVEEAVVTGSVEVGYSPGYLAFREAPLVLAAMAELRHEPELVVCDGQGLAHPARAGLACHVGVELGVPSIGCAKNLLVGSHGPVGAKRGASQRIVDDGEQIGAVLRTQDDVNPVFVSPGHLIDIDSSAQLVLSLAPRFRLPETTRAADQLVRREAKKIAKKSGTLGQP